METYDALLASITPDAGETRTILDPATGTVVGVRGDRGQEGIVSFHGYSTSSRNGARAGMA